MGSINVNRNVTDIFYRYKMPRINAKVEGKGNGIKTVIVNMTEVAKAIGRPATYPTKYFGCELGAQTQFDFKNERYIINGLHDATKLQDLLDGFIRKFVLCPECDNPETELLVSSKKGTISQKCKACGFYGPIKVNHKVITFILKNPPTVDTGTQSSSQTENTSHNSSRHTDTENEVLTTKYINTTIQNYEKGNDEDDNWTADISEEAVRARFLDLTDGAKNMTISDDADKTEKERVNIFYDLVKEKRDACELENVQVHKELVLEAERLDILHKAPLVLAELLFSENIIQEVRKYRNILLRFTHNNDKAQRYLIGGIEQIIALHSNKLLDKVAGILKLFYDNDILEEKSIVGWSQRVSKKHVPKNVALEIHEKAKPFIQWLLEAEEEDTSDNSNEENSEVEIEYSDRAPITPLRNNNNIQSCVNKTKIIEDEEGDDIDIDQI